MPRVSIITALYNHERYFAQAVESVLAQTYADWEHLIWDDGSQDGSLALARSYAERHPGRIKVFTHPGGANRGQENTRNAALEKATGELVCLLDSDDLYAARKLELLVRRFESPRVGLVYGKSDVLVEATGKRVPSGITREPEGRVFEALLRENFIGASATMFRMACVESGMGFDSRFKTIGEYPLWLKIAHDWELAHVPTLVSTWRDHGDNLGTRLGVRAKQELVELFDGFLQAGEYPEHERAIRASLARRRYDYANELYGALELGRCRAELELALREPQAPALLKSKCAVLLAATWLGPRPNRYLARLKRKAWELRRKRI